MKIEYPDNFSLDNLNNTFLWRYVDLHKLIDIVHNQQIVFSRLDNFEDGIEGITGHGVGLKLFTKGSPLTMENINKTFDEETQARLINDDKNRRQEYINSLANSQQTQFASCWYSGDRESLAMWKLYSQKDGVAIKFNARELTDTIIASAKSYTNTDFEILYFGPVEYKNIWPYDRSEKFNQTQNALKKDKSYSHECEFRFVSVTSVKVKGNYPFFKLYIGDLSTYKLEIITNPFMAEWQQENLKSLLSKYNLESLVHSSQMDIRK